MLGTWRVTWAPGVATSTSSRSSARPVTGADQQTARLATGGSRARVRTSSLSRSDPRDERRSVMPETLTATTHVGAAKLAGHIGAEITGADTGTPLSDEVIAKVRQALLEHKVVFLRGQSLNYRRQVAFAERLGPLTLGHPTLASPPGQPLLEEIDSLKGGKANYWHTDVTFVDRPPAFTLLHAVVIPRPAETRSGPTPSPRTRACRRNCATWLTGCGSCTPTTSTTPAPSTAASGSTRRWRRRTRSSSPPSTRPSIRWSGCTRRPANGRSCSAASPAPCSDSPRRRRGT